MPKNIRERLMNTTSIEIDSELEPTSGGGGGSNAADDAAAAAGGDDDKANKQENADANKPSDAEAKLLKEVMKHKEAARAAEAKVKLYEGLDPEKARAALAAQAEAERKELEAKGEYQRIIDQVKQETAAQVDAAKAEADALKQQLADIQTNIERQNVVTTFATSAFVRENLVISGEKVRALYGDHFDVVDGNIVGYDKPRGAPNRTPLVGADANPLPFEAAIEKVLKADPEWERLAKSKLKPGAGGSPAALNEKLSEKPQSGADRIRAGLSSLGRTEIKLSGTRR